MSIDIIIRSLRDSSGVFDKKLNLEDIIKERFSYVKNSEELFIIFPPWGGRLYYNFFLRRLLIKKGFSVLEYEFPKEILSINWKLTLRYFNFIHKSVKQEVKKLKDRYKFRAVNVVGISLGCVNGCIYANKESLVKNLTLVVPGNSIAEIIWSSVGMQKIKKAFEDKNISLKQLKKYWSSLDPANNIGNLETKKISVFISRADKIVPFSSGKKLIDKLQSLQYRMSYEINDNLGHYLTALHFYISPRKFLFD